MKKGLKSMIGFVMLICLIFVTCACSSATESTQTTSNENTISSEASTETDSNTKPYKIGFCISTLENAIYNRIVEGMQASADDLGIEFQCVAANDSVDTQVANIENFITQDMDAIIIHAFDVEAFSEATQQALDAGIIICAYDDVIRDSSTGESLAYQLTLGVDNYDVGYAEGVLAGNWVNETFPDAESVQFGVMNYPTWEFIVARSNGAKDGLTDTANCDIEFVAEQAALYVEDGVSIGENWMLAYPDMVGIIAINDGALVGFCQAWQAAGNDLNDPNFAMFGVDAIKDGIDLLAQGSILRGDIGLDVYKGGYDTVTALASLIEGGTAENVIFEPASLTIDNVADWMADPTKYSDAA